MPFPQKALDVVPADMPGMEYASCALIFGYQVLLSQLTLTFDK